MGLQRGLETGLNQGVWEAYTRVCTPPYPPWVYPYYTTLGIPPYLHTALGISVALPSGS